MKRRQFVLRAIERQQRLQFQFFLAVIRRKREVFASKQMPEIEIILVHYLHSKNSRTDVLVLPEVFDELYGRLFSKFLAVFCCFVAFLPGGDVHESSVLVAADEVHVIVVFKERVG